MEMGASEVLVLAAWVDRGEQIIKNSRIRAMEMIAMTGLFIEGSFLVYRIPIITGD